MGAAGSDVALETADIALMADKLETLPFAIGLSRKAKGIIKQNLCSLLWCNARTSAMGFYQNVGFEKIGEEFDIPTVGPHVLMFKKI